MKRPLTLLTSLGILLGAVTAMPATATAKADNIVLVHGMNMDGGAWSGVFDRLTAKGYQVTVVQLPMTSIEDDLNAARRAISAQNGPVVLVGHSYGGMVISQAGTDPRVEALVYVAAFQPEVGESLAELNASAPAELSQDAIQMFSDGFFVIRPDVWITDVANGVPKAEARYTAMFQTPANTTIFGYKAEAAAWHKTATWSAIATEDNVIAPKLQEQMSKRSGAHVVRIESGHLLPISHPDEITALIEKAAASIE